ncbi:hypothetical protein ABMA28_003196 [Loxostege sticticalis]|uniref:Receptor ligand binding region domain-containing protein n=1 Tax=Loxostege sticticalis TaxID=481309 RepID=A0ABD0SWF3_LOXSC
MKLSILIASLVISVCRSQFVDLALFGKGEVMFHNGQVTFGEDGVMFDNDYCPSYNEEVCIKVFFSPDRYKFERAAIRLGFIVQNAGHPNGINDTINKARKYPNVINLQISIKDLYSDYNTHQKFLRSNLVCATDCFDPNSLTTTRLVSEKILNYNRLVQVIESENFELEDYIQICLPYNSPNTQIFEYVLKENLDWPLKIRRDCAAGMEHDDSMLALITNEPYDAESLLPTIFYQTPYILPEVKDNFPNSMSLSTTWQPLKYALKELLTHMGWYRVAILSDDSAYSLDFVEDLVPFFVKEGITFTDQRCSVELCNFTSPLQFLQAEDARIIILNIDKANAGQLVNDMEKLKGVTWIVRDWPFTKLGNVMSDVFSITLSPDFDYSVEFYPYLSGIKEGIRIIDRIYKNAFGDKEKFQREFAKEANRRMYFGTNAYITLRTFEDTEFHVVAIMTIAGDTAKVFQSTSLYHSRGQVDSSQQCAVRSRAFSKPCAHKPLLLLVGVCVMFALSMLAVVVCFNMFRRSRFYQRIP